MLEAMRGASLGVAAVAVDADGQATRVYTNQALADILGYPLRELQDSQVMLPIVPDELPRFHKLAAEFASGGAVPPILETLIETKDGRRIPIQAALCHGTLDGKRLTVAFVHDLSEQNRIQQALASSEARFRSYAEAAPDAITVIADGQFVYANPAAAKILGFDDVDELLARPLARLLVDPHEQTEMAERIALVARGARLGPKEYRARCKDDTGIDVEISSIATEFEGRPAILAIARNVSERKRMQAEIQRADRMATIGTLAAGVAHEINNPLTFVLLQLRRLEERLPAMVADVGARHEVEAMIADGRVGAERVAVIVRDLLAFVRDPGEQRGPVDVRAAIRNAIMMSGPAVHGRARVVERYEDGIPRADGNEAQLAQVFLNLLVNAAQAFEHGSIDRNEIVVSVRAVDGRVVIEVEDNGPGIPPADMKRVFDPYFTTKPAGVGTGLGLAISRSIVEAMGGEIRAHARPGGGTRIHVALRARPEAAATPTTVKRAVELPARRGRILVIDDEPLLVRALGGWLGDRHDVVVHEHSRRALEALLTDRPFDVILCDVVMPELGGVELYRQLCAARPEYVSRFAFMTAGGMPSGSEDCNVPILRKPFDLDAVERFIAHRLAAG
jgi:PAS domain S-box-containing protein